MRRVLADVKANLLIWWRSPAAVFWSLAFPILLMVVFGAIFGGDGETFTVGVQDHDGSEASASLVAALEDTGALRLEAIDPARDAHEAADDEDLHTVLVVPADYGERLSSGQSVTVRVLTDPTRTQSRTAESIVRAVLSQVNDQVTGQRDRIVVASATLAGAEDRVAGERYIDFFLPGVIGLTVMTNAIMGSIETQAMLKENGILRKIATTPVRRWEWVLSKALYQVVLGFLATAVIVTVGVLFFDVDVRVTWQALGIVVLTAAGFSGLALMMSRWVSKPDHANAAGSAVAMPMMFLSGTFFPLESMPALLKGIALALPLTYVNEGLRAAMITGDQGALVFNGLVTAVLAVVFLALGALLVNWKEL